MPKIEPIKGSSALFGQTSNRDFNRVMAKVVSWSTTVDPETGDKGDFDMGRYPFERFPESRQGWRPEYDSKLRQYDIRHPDGKLWTQKDADECLKTHPLSYPDDWHNQTDAGRPITRCDIGIDGDAYFSHRAWVSIGTEGVIETGDTPFELAKFAMYSGNAGVRLDDGSQFRPGDVRYQVRNPEMEEKRTEAVVDNTVEAFDLFKAMEDDKDKLLDMAVMLGIRIDREASMSKLKRAVLPYITDNKTEGGTPRQRLFRDYAKMNPNDLKLTAMIRRATGSGLIQNAAGVYKFHDGIVGRSEAETVAWFKDAKNSQSLDLLKTEIGDISRVPS